MTSLLYSRQTAWIAAGGLALALVVSLTGGFGKMVHPSGDASYESGAMRVAGASGGGALRLKLEIQYPGPLRDTIIQRWRDPVDGTICYVYLPIAVPHSAGPPGLVQYGQAAIGTMSCFPGPKS